MTIYNAAPYLRESIDSLIAQTFIDWELIAIENGSKDESPSILASYKDPRIRTFSFPENIGRIGALCYAFDQAKSEYIAILDADDIAHYQRFAKQVELLDQHPEVALVGTWAEYIDAKGNVFKKWEPPADPYALHECLGWIDPIVHSSAMYRRKAAVAVGGYPKEYIYAHDFALILNLVEHGKIAIVAEYLCKNRVSSGNMSNLGMHAMDVAGEGKRLMKIAGEKLPLSKKARRMNRCAIAKYEIRCGLANLRGGDIFSGLKRILSALVSNPDVLWTNQLFRSPFHAV
jgi:glycosyltransferase involved in cell wall biosynthesis